MTTTPLAAAALNPLGALSNAVPVLDLFWYIDAAWASRACAILARTDWSAHAAEWSAAGRALSLRTGATVPAPRPAAYTGADTTGVHRVAYGQNTDGSRKPYPVDGGVALLALTGPLTKEGPYSLEDGTSTVFARRLIRHAQNDPDVKAALMRFDTPGGTVAGADDLASDIRRFAASKPIYGYAEDLCASAGYYQASQCTKLYANPAALVGSISTVMSHLDMSKMLADMGVFVDVIVPDDAPYKGAGTPGTALTSEQRGYYKDIVTTFARQFQSRVQRARGLSDEQLRVVTDGRVFPAAQARSLGLIDGVTSYDNVLRVLKAYQPPTS